jgi:hypothetical protein
MKYEDVEYVLDSEHLRYSISIFTAGYLNFEIDF